MKRKEAEEGEQGDSGDIKVELQKVRICHHVSDCVNFI